MTYEELVLKVREAYEDADAREIYDHIAIQVNVEGEAAGAFYVEIANRQICVEPYDYYDRDGLITTTAETIMKLVDNKVSFMEAMMSGELNVVGNMEKLKKLARVKKVTKPKKQRK